MASSSKIVTSIGGHHPLHNHHHQHHHHRQCRSNEGILYYNTVQTSWRPQLPLPKEITNAAESNSSEMEKNAKKESTNKKWSFGRLFRKKKENVDTDSSSDDDCKAGFVSPQKSKKKEKKRRGSKMIGAGFDHIVISPKENEIFLPLGHLETGSDHTRSTNSLDRRIRRERKLAALMAQYQSSSEDEIKSHNSYNSSSISRYRSDESMASGGLGNNRKSRSARNERYYKRLGKEDNVQPQKMLQVSQQVGRWRTESAQVQVHNPMNLEESYETKPVNGLKSSASLSHVPLSYGMSSYSVLPVNRWEEQSFQNTQNSTNSVDGNKRSISYDNQMHLQNKGFELKARTPPPPPPRDPQRRLNVHHGGLRPISYAFDKTSYVPNTINTRCVSDDRLWGPNGSIYQLSLFQRPSSTQPTMQTTAEAMTRQKWPFVKGNSECEISQYGMNYGTNNQNYKYVADAIPRSRKPIHILNQEESSKAQPRISSPMFEDPIIRTTKSGLPATPMQTASDFWKKMEKENSVRRGREVEVNRNLKLKPRSMSSSRVDEPRSYRSPMLETLYKNQEVFKKPSNENKCWVMGQHHSRNKSNPFNSYIRREEQTKYKNTDDIDGEIVQNGFNKQSYIRPVNSFDRRNEEEISDNSRKYTRDFENVVNGSLFIKPVKDKNVIEVCSKADYNKSNSMPNYYQRNTVSIRKPSTPPGDRFNKYCYDQNLDYNQNIFAPTCKKYGNERDNVSETSNKSSNLEDAINELEAIYNSLKLGDEDLLERAERRDIPTPTNFEKYAQLAKEYDEDEDELTGEPDIVKDDVFCRNIKHANNSIKVIDPQPLFGIPLGPIPPSPKTDYLHVIPDKDSKKNRCVPHNNIPDIVGDDLAVRALRKDSGSGHLKCVYPTKSSKKKRATRTQSANIYALIQRDAAKPSGGNLYDYYNFEKGIERSGSMTDVRKETDDIPSTLYLLRSLQDEENKSKSKQSVFRHPSQGGAVYNLPTALKTNSNSLYKPPIPLPRKSTSPSYTSELSRNGMEEVLNQIAKEAKESSKKLGRDLEALRKKALLTNSNYSKEEKENISNPRLQKEIKDIEETSEAAKHYEKILCEIVPPQLESELTYETQPRKLEKEKELLKDISDVSEAAKLCGKMIEDIVVAKHPPIIQTAETVQQENLTKHDKKNYNKTSKNDNMQKLGFNKNEENDVWPKSKTMPNNTKDLNGNNVFSESNLKETTTKYGVVAESLLENIDPNSCKINEIATRCMRQINELNDLTDERISSIPDYDNLKEATDSNNSKTCKDTECLSSDRVNTENDSVVPGRLEQRKSSGGEDDIEKIIKACEFQALKERSNSKPSSSTNEENRTSDGSGGAIFSSSDCLKSTSPSSSFRHPSSSITSIHAFSSSDYIKSSTSSDTNPPSTDPIKTSSSTSYNVKSSSPSTTPSPPPNITPISNVISGTSNNNMSDYNSSDELAMIFGIDQCSPASAGSSTQKTGNTLEIAHACDHPISSYCYIRNANNTTITAVINDHANLMSFTDDIKHNDNNIVFVDDDLSRLNCSYYCNHLQLSLQEHEQNNVLSVASNIHSLSSSSLLSLNADSTAKDITTTNPEIISTTISASTNKPQEQTNTYTHMSLITITPSQNSFTSFASTCLDSIPELHDDNFDENHNDEFCMNNNKNNNNNDDDDDNDESFLKFSNNINIVLNNTNSSIDNHIDSNNNNENIDDTNDDITKVTISHTQLDSLSSLDESNPDSGNVSLNEFPVQNSIINTSLELSLIHNCYRLEIPNNQYSFINQIEIETTSDVNDHCNDDDDGNDDETPAMVGSTTNTKNLIQADEDNNNENYNNNKDNYYGDDDDGDNSNSSNTLINSVRENYNCSNNDENSNYCCINDDNSIEAVNNIDENDLENFDNQNENDCNHKSSPEINNNNSSSSNCNSINNILDNQATEIRQRASCTSSTVQSPKTTTATSSSVLDSSHYFVLPSNSNSSSKCHTLATLNDNNDNDNNNNHNVIMNNNQNQQIILHHAILACTYSIVSNDFYTFLALILAMILLIAFIFI